MDETKFRSLTVEIEFEYQKEVVSQSGHNHLRYIMYILNISKSVDYNRVMVDRSDFNGYLDEQSKHN